MIHLGFGVEFKQPAIIAEALAQAAVHDSWIGPFLLGAEKAAETTGKGKNMVNLLDDIRADKNLSEAAHWDDGNKIRDGIMVRAPDEAIKYASQWKVGKHELVEKNAEMTNAVGTSTKTFVELLLTEVKCTILVGPNIPLNWSSTVENLPIY
jgi:hypothetical protein